MGLPTPPRPWQADSAGRPPTVPADLMGGAGDTDEADEDDVAASDLAAPVSAADLLGPQQGDQLSEVLARATCRGTSMRRGRAVRS